MSSPNGIERYPPPAVRTFSDISARVRIVSQDKCTRLEGSFEPVENVAVELLGANATADPRVPA
jgi:hypothetical protein